MQTCRKCGVSKPLEMFVKRKSNRSGRCTSCKECAAAYMRDYYARRPGAAVANRALQVVRDSQRRWSSRHGLTEAEMDDLMSRHGGQCWACRDRPAVHVDHDHKCCPGPYSCGRCVRGLLCAQCNTAYGLLRDEPAMVERLLAYARQTS